MTTNIERAARAIAESACRELAQPDDIIPYLTQRNLTRAQHLAAEGLLMPDLPEPTRWKQNEEPEWDAGETTVSPAGYEGRVIVEDCDKWEASASYVRNLAYALLAAAKYAEENA